MVALQSKEQSLQNLVDKAEIEDALRRYTRGVDRGDWDLVRSLYHPDAYEDHVEYKGNVDELIAWLKDRFATVQNGLHHLGNCQIEFAGPDLALVETYYVTQRLRPPTVGEWADPGPQDATCWHSMGRYVDRFERRNGAWRVAHRTVVLDARYTTHAFNAVRTGLGAWGARDRSDPLYQARAGIFGNASPSPA